MGSQVVLNYEKINEHYQHSRNSKITSKELGISISSVFTAVRSCKGKVFTTRQYDLNERYFENIDTQDKAYWLGFIAADGCICNNNIVINLAYIDKRHLLKFKKCVECVDKPIYYMENKIVNRQDSISISLHSKDMCMDLAKYGIVPKKCFTVQFPNIRANLIRHFIRGYFDGDGSIYKRSNGGCISFSGNKQMLEGIVKHLPFDATCRVGKGHGKMNYQLRISAQEQVEKLYFWYYDDATTYLDRKKEKWSVMRI